MTKVCHVISGYFRTDARVFQRQCKSLVNGGFEVCLLTNDGQPSEIIDGIEIFSTDKYWENRIKVFFFAKSQFIKKALEIDADIYQMHSPELIYLGLSLKRKGKIVIYDAHEDLPRHILEKEWLPFYARRIVSLCSELFIKYSLKKYNEIISPHSHVVNQLKKINNNTTLITNFPILNEYADFLPEDYFNRGKIMCYTGTVYEYSNQEFILDAMIDIPELRYEIAGYIGDNHIQKLSVHPVFNRVKFLGRIPWSDMRNFYNKTIIGLVIYDYKLNLGNKLGSFGTNKLFEYMEAGLPFICTNYILWEEVVTKHKCGLVVEPGDSNQIRNAIQFLLFNPDKAYEMGQNGRKAVISEYNWNTQGETYVKIFKKYK